MQYQCSLCKQKITGDMITYVNHTEKHIIDLVKTDHPDWIEQSGICTKCLEYYRAELKGSIFKDAACVKRQRKITVFFNSIRNIFKK